MLSALLWAVLTFATFGLRDGLGAVLLLWVPSAVAVAAYRNTRRRHWPLLSAVFYPAMTGAIVLGGIGWSQAPAFAFASLVQAVICAWLSVRVLGSRTGEVRTVTQVIGLFGAAIGGSLAGAVVAFPFRETQTLADISWWFLANVLAILIVTPLLLRMRELTQRNGMASFRIDGRLWLALLGCGLLCGAALSIRAVALMPLLVAAMVGMAVRFGPMAISQTLLAYVTVATLLSLGGENPVQYIAIERGQSVLLMQSWLLTLLSTALPISAMLMKRDTLQHELMRRNSGLHETLMLLDLSEQLARIGRWRLDLVTGAQDWSPLMLELNGLPADLGPDPGDIRHLLPDHGAVLFGEIASHRDTRAPYSLDYRVKPVDGPERILRIAILNEFDMAGQRTGLFGVAMDVSEQVHREASLELARGRAVKLAAEAQKLANTDTLTNLPNRRCTFARLDSMVEAATENGLPLNAIIFDIDHFKGINDTYGHQTGDEVIVQVAELARRQARQSDVVGRIGGEEFVWLLPAVDPPGARALAERLRAAVERGIEGSPLPVVTISIGLAQFRPGDDGDSLLARADAALYEAKQGGRNRVRRAA